MLRDKAFHIGRINKTHGVAGQLTVSTKNKVVEPEEWPEWIFLEIDAGLVPFKVNPDGMVWRDEKHIVIALQDIRDQDLAREMVGNKVWFPLEFKLELLEKEAAKHPLIGFVISDTKTGEIGAIAELIELPNNPLFKIIVDDREVLIPARDEWVIEIDEAGKRIVMDLPEGLVDLAL